MRRGPAFFLLLLAGLVIASAFGAPARACVPEPMCDPGYTPPPYQTPPPTPKPTPKPTARPTVKPIQTSAPTRTFAPPVSQVTAAPTDQPTQAPLDLSTPAATAEVTVPGPAFNTLPSAPIDQVHNSASLTTWIFGFIAGFLIGALVGRASWGVSRRRRRQQIFG
jgi:hypothetical protein